MELCSPALVQRIRELVVSDCLHVDPHYTTVCMDDNLLGRLPLLLASSSSRLDPRVHNGKRCALPPTTKK